MTAGEDSASESIYCAEEGEDEKTQLELDQSDRVEWGIGQ